MNKFVFACLVVVVAAVSIHGSPFNQDEIEGRGISGDRRGGQKSIAPAQIEFFEQEQSPEKSAFKFGDTNGNTRWETIQYQKVKASDGSGDVVVPAAEGGYEYTGTDGVNIRQTYTAGVNGKIYSMVWSNGKPSKTRQ